MFSTPAFWVALISVAALTQLLPESATRWRALAIAAISVAAIQVILGLRPVHWAVIAVAFAWLLVGLRIVSRRPPRRPFFASLAICAPMLLGWTVGKSAVTTPVGRILLFVGLSYMVIKSFTLAKDTCDGRITPDLAVVLAYLLFFPTFVAGPMHLYGEFHATLRETAQLSGADLVGSVYRFVLGMFKVQFLAGVLQPLSLLGISDPAVVPAAKLVVGSMVFSLVLLLNFSGYTDMAIATSAVIGVRTPENFNWPYVANNIREFWQRWHITFSRVLTNYLFIPLTRYLQRHGFSQRRIMLLFVGYVATFLFCGYWHGAGLNFVLWGAYHALGLFTVDAMRAVRSTRSPAVATPAQPLPHVRLLNMAATFVFVSLGWILFVFPIDRLQRLI